MQSGNRNRGLTKDELMVTMNEIAKKENQEMPVYLIVYDIHGNDDIRDIAYKQVTRFPARNRRRLSESAYAVRTSETPLDIYLKFYEDLLDGGVSELSDEDNFFVIRLCKPMSGDEPDSTLNWLESNLAEC